MAQLRHTFLTAILRAFFVFGLMDFIYQPFFISKYFAGVHFLLDFLKYFVILLM